MNIRLDFKTTARTLVGVAFGAAVGATVGAVIRVVGKDGSILRGTVEGGLSGAIAGAVSVNKEKTVGVFTLSMLGALLATAGLDAATGTNPLTEHQSLRILGSVFAACVTTRIRFVPGLNL